MKRMLLVGAALAAMTIVGNSKAEAGGFGIQFHVGHGHGGYGYFNRGYGYSNRGYFGVRRYYSGYRGFRQPIWHDTSHYDYHPGTYVPHGNHLHYIPGHYDFHRTGHWHR